ncbi:hypothetical protein TorRG33x02_148820, partial [Trema orientale]
TLLSSSQAHSLPADSVPQWTPSPAGYLKLNTDASIRTSELLVLQECLLFVAGEHIPASFIEYDALRTINGLESFSDPLSASASLFEDVKSLLSSVFC